MGKGVGQEFPGGLTLRTQHCSALLWLRSDSWEFLHTVGRHTHTHDGTLLRHKKGCSAIYSNTMDPEMMLIPSEGIKTNNMTWYHAHVESKT